MNKIKHKFSDYFKYKYVKIYEKCKHIICLRTFVKSINDKDGIYNVLEGYYN